MNYIIQITEINIEKTLFIVSSKSGSTTEVNALYTYYFDRVKKIEGENAGEHFIVITDEGSPLIELAEKQRFRKVFLNFPEIGGRFSALSYFGILPAALMGVNVKELLQRTLSMVEDCGPQVPAAQNPGVVLGVVLAELAAEGFDKLTYLLPASLSSFGLWLEQLLAESTGKKGKGILPVNGNPLLEKRSYGTDRVFFQLEIEGQENNRDYKKSEDIILMKHPLISILIKDELDLGKEFFRWEIATATVGAIMGVDPFDQPNVQESKKYTGDILKKMKQEVKPTDVRPALTESYLNYYAVEKQTNAKLLLQAFLGALQPRDYISIQAYLPEIPEVQKYISEMRQHLQRSTHLASTSEFGPRYLHSTGQLHKGGINSGIFIQLICSSPVDVLIPGCEYTFGMLKRAQAFGDNEALLKNKRRVILIDLGEDFLRGLESLKEVIKRASPLPERKLEIVEHYHEPYPSYIHRHYDENVISRGIYGR